jgi:hypothetical protein
MKTLCDGHPLTARLALSLRGIISSSIATDPSNCALAETQMVVLMGWRQRVVSIFSKAKASASFMLKIAELKGYETIVLGVVCGSGRVLSYWLGCEVPSVNIDHFIFRWAREDKSGWNGSNVRQSHLGNDSGNIGDSKIRNRMRTARV